MSVIVYYSNVWIYLILTLLSLFFLFKYIKDFDPKNLVDSLIYLTHRTILYILFFTFLTLTIFSVVDFTDSDILIFFQDIAKGLVYYAFFNYGVYYGIKLIYWFKDFYKKNDLFALAFFEDVKGRLKK